MPRIKRYCEPAPGPDESEPIEEPSSCETNPEYDEPEPFDILRELDSDEPTPSAWSTSTLPTPSTPDSVNDVATRQKICVLDIHADKCAYTGGVLVKGSLEECREGEADLAIELAHAFCNNGIPLKKGTVGNPSKKMLFDLRDKIQTDIDNLKMQLPAKQKEFEVFNLTPRSWRSEDVEHLIALAREGKRIAGTPPEAPATNAYRRIKLLEQKLEKQKFLVAREQRLTTTWRTFLSRFKVIERRPQVNIDVEASLLRKRLCRLRDQFGTLQMARIEADLFFKKMLMSLKDSGALHVVFTDFLEKEKPGLCMPTLAQMMYWLVSYATVMSDGSLTLPCDPPKEHGFPIDIIAQLFQLVKCTGPDVMSDLAKLRKASIDFVSGIVGLECSRPLELVPLSEEVVESC